MTGPRRTAGLDQSAAPRVLTVDEAAKVLRISRGLAFAAIRVGDIPHIRIGRRILVPAHALRELIGDAPAASSPDPVSDPKRPLPQGTDAAEDSRQAALRALSATLEVLIAGRETQQPDQVGP